MKPLNLKLLIIILAVAIFSIPTNAQQAILKKVKQQQQQFSKAKIFQPFSTVLENQLSKPISKNTLKEKQILKLNENTVQTLKSKTSTNIKLEFEINNELVVLKLFEADIFSDNFETTTSTLTSRNNVSVDKGLHYWGVVDGNDKSLASISFFNNEVSGFIAFDGDTYVLGKLKNQDYHILYKHTDLNYNNNFTCDVRLPENGVEKQIWEQVNQKTSSTIYCVDIHIEGDYDLYLDFGSDENATTSYIIGLMGQCIIQFANDNIDIQVSYINVWTGTSPYNAASNDVTIMIDDLRLYGWGRMHGDLVHLLTTVGGGGVAYRNVLCGSTYNVGVSSVPTNYNNVPVYSWAVNVVTHELGHNIASPHTHDCFWNGNNTAIDDCGYNSSGGTDGCDGPTPTAGTIMSYCHLDWFIGVDFTLGFGPQPRILMASTINDKFCLNNCSQAACTNLNLDILFDGFPAQTSWDIQDSNGNVVLDSNGNYGSQNGNTSINAQVGCLADGCYTFNMYDSVGNGMCPFQSSVSGASTFVTPGTLITPGSVVGTFSLVTIPGLCGNYQLTNAAGETLASGGGSFGGTQSNSFCLIGGMLQRNAPKSVNNPKINQKNKVLFELEPNVSNTFINVILSASSKQTTLNIFDINGKLIDVLKTTNNSTLHKLNVSDYKPGTYFIQLLNNQNSYTKTFIKY